MATFTRRNGKRAESILSLIDRGALTLDRTHEDLLEQMSLCNGQVSLGRALAESRKDRNVVDVRALLESEFSRKVVS